ncbi:putative signal transducing protein [Aliivibrio fischeri]|uniref:putative signal transducing protein n=1 Tax=Aliivibrio fischeri TaxID=668 RepID=UPI0007C5904C|nr:DUF2007 domain-containing protein [Aliivibrio fischeri]
MEVLTRFSFPHEAHIAKASLEAAGIVSVIADEHTVNAQWLYSNAVGGVRLMVNEADFEMALSIINTDFSEAVINSPETEIIKNYCPNCGSEDLVPFTKGKKPAFVVFILLGFPLFFFKHGYKCQGCNEFIKKVE